jgi:alcohol dehydrogenase class IV
MCSFSQRANILSVTDNSVKATWACGRTSEEESMTSAEIVLPRLMHVGAGARKRLGAVLRGMGATRPLIVSDRTMAELGAVQDLIDDIAGEGIRAQAFTDTVPEPTAASIAAGVEVARDGDFDAIVALGGGSPIDSAKAIAILAVQGGTVAELRFPRRVDEPGLPIVAIPTTAGTGSEVTKVTVITQEGSRGEVDEKLLCMGIGFMPWAALVDFELTLSLPPRVTVDSGIDALSHAIEAYVSRKASPFSDAQALAALRAIGPNLRRVFDDGTDRAAREAMMAGATLAGMAFSNASVALVHGMSRPIGAAFHVPHGMSNAMLLPAVTAFGLTAAPARYAACARAMGVAPRSDDDAAAAAALLDELRSLNVDLGMPTPVGFGIDESAFRAAMPGMALQALASGSPSNNPRVPSEEEIVGIYAQLLA